MPPPRLFAVIPAAGLSLRMGRPKLLLPLGGMTVIARLLAALARPEIVAIAVVIRRDDVALREEVERHGGWAVTPDDDPPDMRASVECGLRAIQDRFQPQPVDGWLMLPADHPVLDYDALTKLIVRWTAQRPRFLRPVHAGRNGHPLIARWDVVPEIAPLPPEQGLNQLLRQFADEVVAVPVDSPGVLVDLDSPADYERLREMFPAGDNAANPG